jgi:general secretion pathway protein A
MYREFFDFSEDPFAFSYDPKFFYMTENHKEVLNSLVDGITEQKGFILLTGETGTGKTTLINKLSTLLDSSIKAFPIFQPTNNINELLEEVVRGLEFPLVERNKGSLLATFNNYLIEKSIRGENSVLIVDEAQALSNDILEELRLLCNQDPRRPFLLQEVFVGQPDFEDKLKSYDLRQLHQRITGRYQLRPLTPLETIQYIEFRLNQVGSSIKNVFTQEAAELICWRSRGILSDINRICYLTLSLGYAISRRKIGVNEVKAVLSLWKLQKPGKSQRFFEFMEGFITKFRQGDQITIISYSLLSYSLLLWIIIFFLYWNKP